MDKIVINPVAVIQREPVHVVQLMDHVSVKVATMGMHALMVRLTLFGYLCKCNDPSSLNHFYMSANFSFCLVKEN